MQPHHTTTTCVSPVVPSDRKVPEKATRDVIGQLRGGHKACRVLLFDWLPRRYYPTQYKLRLHEVKF